VQGVQGVGGVQGFQGVQGIQGYQGPAGLGSNTIYAPSTIAITGAAMDDYRLGSGTLFRLTGTNTATTNITGFIGDQYGRFITLVNDTNAVSTVNILNYDRSGSAAGNQFFLPCSQSSVTINALGESAQFVYSSVTNLSNTFWCLLQANTCAAAPAPP